jgi:hypothetical protein
MFRVLFLILVLLGSSAFSLIPKSTLQFSNAVSPIPKPTTILPVDTVYKTGQGKLKKATEKFLAMLENDKECHGYIINYGTDKEVARRERIINNSIKSSKIDSARIMVVNGGKAYETKSVFYILPWSAESPTPQRN